MDQENSTLDEESIHLKDYLQVLLRRKYIILLVFIVCLPIVIIQAFSYEPLYRASSKILVERNETPALLTNAGLSYNPGFLSTQRQIITSSKVGEKVVRNLVLGDTYRRYFPLSNADPSAIQKIRKWLGQFYKTGLKLAGLTENEPIADAGEKEQLSEAEKQEEKIKSLAMMISNSISVENPDENDSYRAGNILEVSFISSNPKFAKTVVNSVASAYKQLLMEMRMESTAETIEWLKAKAASQREKLEASEKELQEYKKAHDIYTVDNEEALFPSKIQELSNSLTQAQTEVRELESLYQEIKKISTQEALNLPVVAENIIVGGLRQKIIDKEQEIQGLSKTIGIKHPRMIRAKKDLAALKTKLEAEIQGVIESVKNKYMLAKEKADNIQRLLDQTKQSAAIMSDKFIQYEILNRDVEVNRLLYDRLISRIKEYNATENKQTIDVWVVEEARTPEAPMSERPKRTLLLGLLVSLMAGIGLAFFLEYLDNTVKTAEDAEAKLDEPVLGMVPLYKAKSPEIEKIVHYMPKAVVSERYKAIRTAVLLSSPKGPPKSLMVSSMAQGVGKTATASNLSLSFAQVGRRVLMIDGDMRNPNVHKIFEMDNTKGLSTYLAGEPEMVILKSKESEFLDVMTSGPIPPNPSELLSSSRLDELIQKVHEAYDFVIFDSPPMAAVTDALLIGKAVEQTILVARSGVSTYQAMKQADRALKAVNGHVLGQIINAVDEKKQNYYYYKYYGSYGAYAADEKPPAS